MREISDAAFKKEEDDGHSMRGAPPLPPPPSPNVRFGTRRIKAGEAPKGRRVFKASTSSRMRQLLRAIAVYGTGKNADAPGYRVGGKTGSAEKPGGSAGYRKTSTSVRGFSCRSSWPPTEKMLGRST